MAVLLMTDPSGARLPRGKVTVLVSPRPRARSGSMMTSSGATPSAARSRSRSVRRRSQPSHQSSRRPSGSPATVSTRSSSSPRRRRCSMTSGTPPARNARTVGCGPFGSVSTRRGTRRLTSIQSSTVGRRSPAACAMAGMCSSRLVEPPKAACTAIALRTAASVTMSRTARPRRESDTSARAERRAMSTQIGWPDGASAEWGSDSPSASPTTCEVAAVPRNWQPPPGEPHARQPRSAAWSSVSSPWAKRAPIDWTLPASSPSRGGSVTPPGTSTHGRSRMEASAIIVAGSPLSHVATPSTPRRVGSERISRRKTWAASLR